MGPTVPEWMDLGYISGVDLEVLADGLQALCLSCLALNPGFSAHSLAAGPRHVEQRDGVPAAGAAPRVPQPAAHQQRQRDEVPQHPGREHHGADGWAFAGGEPLSSIAVLWPGVIGGIAHGGAPEEEMRPPLPPACTWLEEGLRAGVLRDTQGKGRDRNPEPPAGPQRAQRAGSARVSQGSRRSRSAAASMRRSTLLGRPAPREPPPPPPPPPPPLPRLPGVAAVPEREPASRREHFQENTPRRRVQS
ncbi:uncharacterized protein [Pseudorca crassidens]|uniref:uncharacterized protein n=1 Tax=Pseudorca crassidens TaxID=82174 RepID=UPI00352DD5B4